jgi:ER membrane protein complex subunit 1
LTNSFNRRSRLFFHAVATPHGKVMSIPRRALDPRRPKRKTTAEDAEEFLIQYDPLLPDDSRHTLSHYYKVIIPSRHS